MPLAPHRNLRRSRMAVCALLAVLALLGASACDFSLGPQRDPMIDFVDAVNAGKLGEAAYLTDDPAAAEQALRATFDGMGDATAHLSTMESLLGTMTTHIAWTLPDGSKTETTGTIGNVHDGKVPWSPHIIDSRLQPGGRMVYTEKLDYESPVIGRRRDDLMTWQTVTAVSIADDAPAADVDALAAILHGIDPSITAASIDRGMRTDAEDGRYRAATLRSEDADPVRGDLDAIATVSLQHRGRLLTTDPRLDSPALDGVPKAWRAILSKSAGWKVEIDNPGDGADVRVQAKKPEDVQNVQLTMDARIQRAAQQAVGATRLTAALVAVDAADGGVLAVAQNDAADARGPVVLEGLYPPGSVFKLVTTAAALGSGTITPDGTVDCPASAQFEGRTITNTDGFSVGAGPLQALFARPCDTTQAALAQALPRGALSGTAHALGLGIGFDTPGLATKTGAVPRTDPGGDRAAAAVGQGQVVASPFGMAVAAASLAHEGKMITPTLITGEHATVQGSDDPGADGRDGKAATKNVSKDTARAVRAMMAEAVRSGTADALRGVDGLKAVAGVAAAHSRPGHGWFVGIDHDIAFAVFVQNADDAQPAIDMAGHFLDAAHDAIGDYS